MGFLELTNFADFADLVNFTGLVKLKGRFKVLKDDFCLLAKVHL